MIVEMHCHTSEFSKCSHVPAAQLLRRAVHVGLQTIVLTDHHFQWEFDALAVLRAKAQLPSTFGILAGQEIETSDFGHILLYGASETVEAPFPPLEQIRQKYPNAAIVWAHPYRDGKIPSKERLLSDLIDAVEIFNSNYSIAEAARALKDWHRFRFTATGGTDTHGLYYVGMYPTIFDHAFSTMAEMVIEIKAGRCRPYFKEIASAGTSRTQVTELTVGPKRTHQRKTIIIKTFSSPESWKEGEKGQVITEILYRHGFDRGSCRVARPLEKDKRTLSVMEEKIFGRTLYNAMVGAEPPDMRWYLEMTACWLCKLHNARFKITPENDYLEKEPDRLDYYLSSLTETGHRFLDRVTQIRNLVLQYERQLILSHPELLLQCHGDYHAKNIYVCKDKISREPYIAAIDLESSYQIPRAFDVGNFLAQYVNMFFDQTRVQQHAPSDVFYRTYLEHADELEEGFGDHVSLFKARTSLSILYYLVKVKMGDSPNFWRVMVEAERDLASIQTHQLENQHAVGQ
ncbi:MAG: phosphotransferase [Planctomycetaceae bacterium]|nr:phosphotransferase [Planctomycetaceae bacterium]